MATIERKNDVIEYLEEHIKYNSKTAGTSNLDEKYRDVYASCSFEFIHRIETDYEKKRFFN